ncbi:MAG: type Z 30S ribosomal protein S14 [Acidobacteriota bacterium]
MAKKSAIAKALRAPKFLVRQHNRCRICGRPRGYLRKFQMCRLCFRKLALAGDVPGLVKSSW